MAAFVPLPSRREEIRLHRQTAYRAFLPPLIVLSILTCLLIWQIQILLADARWVEHTDLVITQAHHTLQTVLNTQASLRSYLTSGNPTDLKPYSEGRTAIGPLLDQLAVIVQDNPAQAKRLDEVRADYDAWQRFAQLEISLRRQGGKGYLGGYLQGAKRGNVNVALFRTLSDFLSVEEGLRRGRAAMSHASTQRGLIGGAVLLPVLCLFLALSTRQQLHALGNQYEEMARAEEEAIRAAEDRQRRFVREVLASVTEGRLRLCESDGDLPAPLSAPTSEPVMLTDASLAVLRRVVQEEADRCALPMERTFELLLAVGEAAMNAVVHAGAGEGWVCTDPSSGRLQVWVRDHGAGISQESLHRATLEKGFTTAGTLGHGFGIMTQSADRLYLLTSASGTTVVLEQERTAPIPDWMEGLALVS